MVTVHAGHRRRRLVSSVWLPWIFGLLALLTIAGAVVAVGGRVDRGVAVPATVLDMQQADTQGAAQHVRRALRTSLLDVAQVAGGLTLAGDTSRFDAQVKEFANRYGRYRSVYVLDSGRQVLARTGGAPHPELVPDRPPQPGMTEAVAVDKVPVVVQYAPFTFGGGHAVVVAEYDLVHLRHSLDGAAPATVWLVNAKGEVLASTAGFTAFQRLDRDGLRRAAASAVDGPGVTLGGGSLDAREIVAMAPVRGTDKVPGPSWGLVTARSVNTVVLPETQARDQALLVALAVAVVTVGVFGWMYLLWLRPLRRLVRDVTRLADGDLGERIEVRRHDELGLIAAAVERLRTDPRLAAGRAPLPEQVR